MQNAIDWSVNEAYCLISSVDAARRTTGLVGRTGESYSNEQGDVVVIVDIDSAALTDEDWMPKAACKGLTHLFFPTPAERPQARERREATAREVCSSCSVRGLCRDFARNAHEYGFWGGESEDERHGAGYRLIAPIGVRARSAS